MACPTTHRQGRRRAVHRLAVLCSLCLGGCTYRTQVPAVDGAHLGDIGGRQPGRFAALVQKDAWRMKVDVEGLALRAAHLPARRRAVLGSGHEERPRGGARTVDFVLAIGPPASLPVPYDAQIGSCNRTPPRMSTSRRDVRARCRGRAKLKGALRSSIPTEAFSTRRSRRPDGRAAAVSPAVRLPGARQASAQALRGIVERAAMTAKLRLAQHRSGEAQPAAASNPPVTWQNGQMVK